MSECTMWAGKIQPDGYGYQRVEGKRVLAHVLVWLAAGRKIPRGYELDHTCNVRACVNLDHLEPVTKSENMRRMHARRTPESYAGAGNKPGARKGVPRNRRLGLNGRETCANGHPWTDANVRVTPDGYTVCRPCQADAKRRSNERYRKEHS